MLKLFLAPLSAFPGDDNAVPLSVYRRERLSHISGSEKRHEAIAAEALMNRAVLSCLPELPLPLDVVTGENGKPYLRGGELCFNLSHSGNFAVCAVSDREVGVDVQLLSSYNPAVVKRFFALPEQKHILASEDRDSAFTEVWSKKESYIKATGRGLSTPLAEFSVVPVAPEGYSIRHRVYDGHHISVCLRGEPETAEVIIL